MAKKSGTKKPKAQQPKSSQARKKRKANAVPWKYLVAPLLIVLGGVALLGYLAVDVDTIAGRVNQEADQWAGAYWRKPIPPQGAPPAGYLPAAKGLLPRDCAACHPAQFTDWSGSLHSTTMGPGVAGQFPRMRPATSNQCRKCHAPMSEQAPQVFSGGVGLDNPVYDAPLEAAGLTCSACHLRKHRRHGPPLLAGKEPVSQLFHGEPIRTPFFEASEFCKGCHQHAATTLKINGKTVENTYQEWLASPYAEQGTTCQKCHMPERRHLWRGIHDKEMTLSGVTITTRSTPESPLVGESVTAELTVENTGTGHAFPTYTTPVVFLRAAFLGDDGNILRGGYFEEKIIQRRLNMSTRPWTEDFDTRLLPGQSMTLRFSRVVPAEAKSLYLWVWVEPDHFYSSFFRARLKRGAGFPGAAQLQEALNKTMQRRYSLFSRSIPIQRAQ